MLTDSKLKTIKPAEKAYKVSDRDGLYITVLPSGTISFRYNYRLNGRQETLVLGKYGPGNLSLAEARAQLIEAKKTISLGLSPSRKKVREKSDLWRSDNSFDSWARRYLERHKMAPSSRKHRTWAYECYLAATLGRLNMREITHNEARFVLEAAIKRGTPSIALMLRQLIMGVFKFAADSGYDFDNPVLRIKPHTLARNVPRERVLSPEEVRIFFKYLGRIKCPPVVRMAIKAIMLTMVRKGEFCFASWEEFDFEAGVWNIPAARMKARKAHVVYLSHQVINLLHAIKAYNPDSPFVMPSHRNSSTCIDMQWINRMVDRAVAQAQKEGEKIDSFSPHDLRRTASTFLHEAGYSSDWIEKSLAHTQTGIRAVYNKAAYEAQRRVMHQDWADIVDSWISGKQEEVRTSMANLDRSSWEYIQVRLGEIKTMSLSNHTNGLDQAQKSPADAGLRTAALFN